VLKLLGSCNISQDQAAAYGCCWNSSLCLKGLNEEDFDWCIEQTFSLVKTENH
jgi:hypothetical protein